MNKVSILIPFLKVDSYFMECLLSLRSITDNDVDLILVHDRLLSDSETKTINKCLEEIMLPSTIIYSNKVGISASLNFGISLSTGEYICRFDSDDIFQFSRIGIQRSYLDANPDVAAVGGQMKFIDGNGNLIRNRVSKYPVGKIETRKAFETGCYLAHPAVMYRKASVQSVGSYRESFKYAEDYDLWLRLLDFFELDNVPDVVIYYREHSNQLSSKNDLVSCYSIAATLARKNRSMGITPDIPETNFEKWVEGLMNKQLSRDKDAQINLENAQFRQELVLFKKLLKSKKLGAFKVIARLMLLLIRCGMTRILKRLNINLADI